MENLSPLSFFLLLTVLPAGLMFICERLTLRFLARASWGYNWVRGTFWMHPNFISRCRYPMGLFSVALFHAWHWLPGGGFLWQHLGVWNFTFWIITDISDGTIARDFDLHTEEGKSIDPLSDKLLLFPPLLYFAWLGLIRLEVVTAFILFDFFGQFARHFITQKAANLFGKAKTFLGVITIVLLTTQFVYFPPGETWIIAHITLWGAAILAFFSAFFKIVPRYWYANILSLMNFACGLVGIWLTLMWHRPDLAFAAVFAGQFLDLFDGRAAQKWGSTPRGELLDDLADGTNFGGTIAIIIYASLPWHGLGLFLGGLHFFATAFRLTRFLLNKRAAGTQGGVSVFMGLPSPAGALVAGSVILAEVPVGLKAALIVANSFFMVSKIPYIHFGRVILPKLPKIILVILLTCILIAVMFGIYSGGHQILYWFVFGFSLAYLVLGVRWKATQPQQPS